MKSVIWAGSPVAPSLLIPARTAPPLMTIASPKASQEEFWSPRKVAWYRRANARSDYAARVLAAAEPYLGGVATALDVGAGFGALAVPLARRVARVTALEPAPAMAAALADEVSRQGLRNVEILQARWGELRLPPHDLVLCAHVGPLLGGESTFLAALPALARRAVVLVRDMPGGDDKFWFAELYPRFLGRPYERCCDYEATLAALGALGVVPAVVEVAYTSDQPFDSLDEACEFWAEYMGLDAAAVDAGLRPFLAARLRREGGGWVAPFRKRAAVIAWRVGEGAG